MRIEIKIVSNPSAFSVSSTTTMRRGLRITEVEAVARWAHNGGNWSVNSSHWAYRRNRLSYGVRRSSGKRLWYRPNRRYIVSSHCRRDKRTLLVTSEVCNTTEISHSKTKQKDAEYNWPVRNASVIGKWFKQLGRIWMKGECRMGELPWETLLLTTTDWLFSQDH